MKNDEFNKKKFFKDLLLKKVFIFEDKETLDLYILKKSKKAKSSNLINVTENNKIIHFCIEEMRMFDLISVEDVLVNLDTTDGNLLGHFYKINKEKIKESLDKS